MVIGRQTPPKDDAAMSEAAAQTRQTAKCPASTSGKPLWRGWIHTVMVPVMVLGGLGLMIAADHWGDRLALAVWTLTGLMLFGNSAAYHRGRWSMRTKSVLQRIDHANIAVFIAGTYTPLAVSMSHGSSRVVLLAIIWACALIGVGLRFWWSSVPRWVSTALYVVMGWTALWWLPQFWRTGGPAVVILILGGGVFYTIGAVCYARRRPNPSPRFGFHEVFHAGTAVGAICHGIAIGLAVL